MHKVRYIIAAVLLMGVTVLGWAAVGHAQSFRTGDNVTVPAGRTVDSSLYASGRTIDIAGTVDGDVFCVGQTVTISGTVRGDVICAGQTVLVSGRVAGDIRVAGQNVTISNTVGANVSAAGQTLTLDSDATISGDAGLAGQDVTLNGPVGRDLAVAGANVTINSAIGRNIRATVEQLTLQEGASVGGDIAYTSNQDLTKDTGATVDGTVTRSAPKTREATPAMAGSMIAISLAFALYMLVAALLFALVLVLVMPRVFHVATEAARQNLGKTLLVGLVASIAVPVVLIALMFTVVGIPLALFAGLVWFVFVVLSGPFAAYLAGRLMLQHTHVDNAIWTMLLGAFVLLLLYCIPFIGALVGLLALWFGLGTLLMRVAYHYQKPHYHMAPETIAVVAERKPSENRKPRA